VVKSTSRDTKEIKDHKKSGRASVKLRSRTQAKPATGCSASRSAPRLVFLVGFMGAGKSSVGRALAERLGWVFEDLDERIEAGQGRSIDQIFRESGEVVFRRIEHAALRELLSESLVSARAVALGGGAFAQAKTAALVKKSRGTVVFLDARAEELFERCRKQDLNRPLLRSLQEFRRLYLARRPFYAQAGQHIMTGGKDVATIVEEVIRSLALQGGSKESAK